jgi:hypothetical protein
VPAVRFMDMMNCGVIKEYTHLSSNHLVCLSVMDTE